MFLWLLDNIDKIIIIIQISLHIIITTTTQQCTFFNQMFSFFI